MRFKKILLVILIFLFGVGVIIGLVIVARKLVGKDWPILSPLGSKVEEKKESPLVKYEFERLKSHFTEASQDKGEIVLERILNETEDFTSYLFSYVSEGRKITGLANIPLNHSKPGLEQLEQCPVIVMLRGWVDPEMYETGIGTQKAGEVFASNGYITLAPDYLGYGKSDNPPNNIWEERFIKNINIADLLVSISSLPQADASRIGIWGHSNGGLSALTALELTGRNCPTTLWAPVSKFFPYDVLYYIWEADDKGKALRKSLAEFEEEYDADKYSFDEYLEWIKAPIQLHQGLADPYIPVSWSDALVGKLEGLGNEVNYYTYPEAGHHMEESWDLVVQRDLQFFGEKLK